MVGHTHNDIDQFFSVLASIILRKNIKSMEELVAVIDEADSQRVSLSFCQEKGILDNTKLQNQNPVRCQLVSLIADYKRTLALSCTPIFSITNDHLFAFEKVEGRLVVRSKEWAESPEWKVLGSILQDEVQDPSDCLEKNLKDLQDFEDALPSIEKTFFLNDQQKQDWDAFLAKEKQVQAPSQEQLAPMKLLSKYAERVEAEDLVVNPILDIPSSEIVSLPFW